MVPRVEEFDEKGIEDILLYRKLKIDKRHFLFSILLNRYIQE